MFYSPDFCAENVLLNEEESHHIMRVLRMNVGDVCEIMDGKGNVYTAKITKIMKRNCAFFIQNVEFFPKKEHSFHLAISPTKSIDRIEFMLEKCVELGIDKISFLITEHSERKQINLERLQKIVIAATKQSKQKYIPIIEDMILFKKFIEKNSFENNNVNAKNTQYFLAHIDKETQSLKSIIEPKKNILMLIGAEGDFSKDEIIVAKNKKFEMVSLGESRLRTETAGLYANFVYKWINE